MASSLSLIVSVESLCPLAILIVVCRACCPRWACCLLCRACCLLCQGCRDVGEALLYDGESGGGVELVVHDRVYCWARGLLSTWWRPKEVGETWRSRRGSVVTWLLSDPLVSFVTPRHLSPWDPLSTLTIHHPHHGLHGLFDTTTPSDQVMGSVVVPPSPLVQPKLATLPLPPSTRCRTSRPPGLSRNNGCISES